MAAVIPADPRPEPWQPTRNWDQVAVFWDSPGSAVERVLAHKPIPAGTVGEGPFLVSYKQYRVRGDDPLVTVCRAMVLEAFGADIDVEG